MSDLVCSETCVVEWAMLGWLRLMTLQRRL